MMMPLQIHYVFNGSHQPTINELLVPQPPHFLKPVTAIPPILLQINFLGTETLLPITYTSCQLLVPSEKKSASEKESENRTLRSHYYWLYCNLVYQPVSFLVGALQPHQELILWKIAICLLHLVSEYKKPLHIGFWKYISPTKENNAV